MSANESFEELASQFKKDTGLLAPGKGVPVAAGNDPAYGQEYRRREWDKWLKKREGKMKGKPPILSDESIGDILVEKGYWHYFHNSQGGRHQGLWEVVKIILEAQRDADVKWFGKSKCEHCDTPLLREGELYEKLEQARQEAVKEIKPLVDKLFAVLENADFSNGVVYMGVDEGRVRAGELIKGCKEEWQSFKTKYLVGLTLEEEANKQAYKEEVEDKQRDTAEGYRYV